MIPELFKAWVFGTVRHFLSAGFVYLASKGIVTGEQSEATLLWVSGAVAAWLWSLYEKWRASQATERLKGGDPNGV